MQEKQQETPFSLCLHIAEKISEQFEPPCEVNTHQYSDIVALYVYVENLPQKPNGKFQQVLISVSLEKITATHLGGCEIPTSLILERTTAAADFKEIHDSIIKHLKTCTMQVKFPVKGPIVKYRMRKFDK